MITVLTLQIKLTSLIELFRITVSVIRIPRHSNNRTGIQRKNESSQNVL